MIKNNQSRDANKDVIISVDYKIHDIKQSFTMSYKTMLPFDASYYQDTRTEYKNGTGVNVMTNRTRLTFTQPVS